MLIATKACFCCRAYLYQEKHAFIRDEGELTSEQQELVEQIANLARIYEPACKEALRKMKITITPTDELNTRGDGLRIRRYDGVTDQGTPCDVWVQLVCPRNAADEVKLSEEFGRPARYFTKNTRR